MADNEIKDEPDDFDADVRNAISDLKIADGQPPEARVEIDHENARPRDETGKFIETDKAKPVQSKMPEAPAGGIVADPVQQIGQQPATVQVPKGLKPEFKAKFAELPPDWQAEITRREADSAKVLASQDEERLMGKRINEMANPYLPTIRAEGATVEKAFSDYLQTAHVLRSGTDQQKAHAIATVMHGYKVNPQVLFSILQGGNVNGGVQPVPNQFDPRVNTLEQRLAQIEQERQTEIQQRQLQEQHSLQSQIDEFSSKAGHEHFDRVKVHMGVLLENDIAKDLEDAYQRAIYADPEIRSTLTPSGQRITEQNAKTARAKSAAVSVTGAPGSSRPLNGSGSIGSIEDDLRAAMREHTGRV